MPPVVWSGSVSNPTTFYYSVTTSANVTWSATSSNWTVIPSQSTFTYASGITSRPEWQAARARHITYRQHNEAVRAQDMNLLRVLSGNRFDSEESQREAREEWDRRQAERRQQGQEARARAESLLLQFLDETQRAAYAAGEPIEVIGSHGGRFQITRRAIANITVLNQHGDPIADLCAHPDGAMPAPDIWLAQKLALETDERRFVLLANTHRGRPIDYDAEGRMLLPLRRAIYGRPIDGVDGVILDDEAAAMARRQNRMALDDWRAHQ